MWKMRISKPLRFGNLAKSILSVSWNPSLVGSTTSIIPEWTSCTAFKVVSGRACGCKTSVEMSGVDTDKWIY